MPNILEYLLGSPMTVLKFQCTKHWHYKDRLRKLHSSANDSLGHSHFQAYFSPSPDPYFNYFLGPSDFSLHFSVDALQSEYFALWPLAMEFDHMLVFDWHSDNRIKNIKMSSVSFCPTNVWYFPHKMSFYWKYIFNCLWFATEWKKSR